jgi:hypothetical protein
MNIDQFRHLPLDEKTNYLWDNGICLNQRMVNNEYIVCIFSLADFFVEAVYSKKNNRVDRISPILGQKSWERYVDGILHQLLSLS